MRLIDADAFKSRMSGVYEEYMWDVLEEMPTVDVQKLSDIEARLDDAYKHGYSDCFSDMQKVKHGRWIENMEVGGYFCSECGKETEDRHDEPITIGTAKGFALVLPYYCGFCGAKMDMEGDKDEET